MAEDDIEIVDIVQELLNTECYLKRKIMLVSDKKIFDRLDECRFPNKTVSKLQIDSFIAYYRFNSERLNMIVAALDKPEGRKGSLLLGLNGVTKKQIVECCFWQK